MAKTSDDVVKESLPPAAQTIKEEVLAYLVKRREEVALLAESHENYGVLGSALDVALVTIANTGGL